MKKDRKNSLLKLGFATLIAASTMLAAKPAKSAGLCVYRYTLPNGTVCTFVRYEGRCCLYTDASGTPCPPICGV
jgi:hypothetical protein